jgi:predicted 3-demethylubiquinone-9 3-methyltransferase (glyoxalase superfamily)
MKLSKISPCLWFDDTGEAAARFYCSVFKHSEILAISHFGTAGYESHRRPAGSVMTVEFELEGLTFTALNGGPAFTFNEAVSLQVMCDTQDEIDYYWNALSAGGDPKAQQCGWLKDKFGLSWQVAPASLAEMFADKDSEKTGRLMVAMLEMKKFDIAALKKAYDGK